MGTARRPQSAFEDDRRPLRAMVVDDHPLNRLVMRTLLAESGCAVTVAETGEEAVRLACRQAFDLVVMDLNLPGITGDEAAAAIRRAGASRNAFIARWSTDADGRLSGALYDGALPKPIRYAELTATVALAHRRMVNRAESSRRSRADSDRRPL